ncbi:hypothetical protein BO82DRAFT_385086 [Aspergillus uvarum CBS 121591]|uniref:Rhodopsin domain-containing protein n=1 Tax=Aspergillus uvarum CBS 121591 TaxID=1448315 RepID=A0A319C399_9EURO|nr:hypothetical protein BO82DRAFT_385086 [Aspergillus uvarum CBS 121591]PYH79595.1 hypothetical protein BO82DRAFT_385086 [Aspergillus uvarum CBS 121591]
MSGLSLGPQGTHISFDALIATLWTFTALSCCSIIFRLYVRLLTYRRLFLDDALVVLAWAMMLATTVMWQVEGPALYHYSPVFSGKTLPTLEFLDAYTHLQGYLVAWLVLFYSGLWLVKLSFLTFFYTLGTKIRSHRVWWWIVFGITIAWWIICIGIIDYRCTINSTAYTMAHCGSIDRVHHDNKIIYGSCAGDIVTDALILSVPIFVLWNSQLPLRQKMVLFAFFLATVVVMAVAIVRVAVGIDYAQTMDISWVYFWSCIEMGTAVMVACAASFRQLYITSRNRHLFGKGPKVKQAVDSGHRRLLQFQFQNTEPSVARDSEEPSTHSTEHILIGKLAHRSPEISIPV